MYNSRTASSRLRQATSPSSTIRSVDWLFMRGKANFVMQSAQARMNGPVSVDAASAAARRITILLSAFGSGRLRLRRSTAQPPLHPAEHLAVPLNRVLRLEHPMVLVREDQQPRWN